MGILIRHLPADAALVTALNDHRPQWGSTEHLLADLWVLLVRINSKQGTLRDDFDHPLRAEVTAKAKAVHKQALKILYLKRKKERPNHGAEVTS